MSSNEESDMEIDCTPPNLRAEAKLAMENMLPKKSKEKYMKVYDNFMTWRNEKCSLIYSEQVVKISPLNLEEFLPWACSRYGNKFRIAFVKTMEPHKGSKQTRTGSKLKSEEKDLKSSSDLSEFQEEIDTAFVDLKYEKDNLVHIKIEMSKPIPRELLAVIALIVKFHPLLNGITITSGADQFNVYELSKILPISNITVLYLDGNVIKEANFDILLDKINRLQVLSLARCSIGDNGVKNIAEKLHYPAPASMTLCVLNLSSNNLTDISCKYIAEALRSNRKLNLLNMAGNKITDDGGLAIINVLQQFPLTSKENIAFRQRYMDYLKGRQEVIDRYLTDIGANSVQRAKNKDKRKSIITTRKIPGPSDYERIVEAAVKIYGEFVDPMMDCTTVDGLRYCNGNRSLVYLNLAYNSLTFAFLNALIAVVKYQSSLSRQSTKGLINVVLEGNPLPSKCIELLELDAELDLGLTLATKKKSVVKKRPAELQALD